MKRMTGIVIAIVAAFAVIAPGARAAGSAEELMARIAAAPDAETILVSEYSVEQKGGIELYPQDVVVQSKHLGRAVLAREGYREVKSASGELLRIAPQGYVKTIPAGAGGIRAVSTIAETPVISRPSSPKTMPWSAAEAVQW